jgi:hypothetical protein
LPENVAQRLFDQRQVQGLSHGVGIISLGFLMDAITDKYRSLDVPPVELFCAELGKVADRCAWTKGTWVFSPDKKKDWNEIQNISKDIELISNFLLTSYKQSF